MKNHYFQNLNLSISNWQKRVLTMVCFMLFIVNYLQAQVAVITTNPTNTAPNLAATYTSVALALTALNAVTAMTGPVTLTLAAGTETAPPTGLQLGSTTLNPVLSATNSITIIGAGSATILKAGVGTATPASAVSDGVLKFVGADYVTLDAVTFTDENTTNPATMEVGLGMFKLSATDGCNNNTIQNCIFNMQRINFATGTIPMVDGSVAIAMMNSTVVASTTNLTITIVSGASSNNKFYSNKINNGNYGIVLRGFAAASPFTLADTNNDVGGAFAATGNTILNYGGGALATNASAAIRLIDQWAFNASYNTTNNNNGFGLNHVNTLRGIITSGGISASGSINNNTITLFAGGTTSQLEGISNNAGATPAVNTVNINNNTIVLNYATATNTLINGIINSAATTTINVNNNNVSAGSIIPGLGTHVLITGGSPTTLNISGNTLSNFQRSSTGAGALRGIVYTSPATTNISNNIISNLGYTDNASTGLLDGIYSFTNAVDVNITNNQIYNLRTAGGAIRGIIEFGNPGNKVLTGNTVYDFANTTGYIGTGVQFVGIRCVTGNIAMSRNKVFDITTLGTTGSSITGLEITGGSNGLLVNNFVGNLYAPTSTALNAIRGIDISGGLVATKIYHNTVRLNANTTSVTTFGTTCLMFSTTPASMDVRNNIFVNTSTPAQESLNTSVNGVAAGIRRVSGAAATIPANYADTSNSNLIWVNPTAGTNNHAVYAEGTFTITNLQNTVANLKTFMVNRDQLSVEENPDFVSTTGIDATFLHFNAGTITQAESGAIPISTVTADFDGDLRNAIKPDIGADEFAGITLDISAPNILHTALSYTCTPGETSIFAQVTDASGVPISGTGLPVAYWKLNSGPYTPATGVLTLPGLYEFVIGTGSVIGNTISYYIVAQDNAATPNITSLPSAGANGFTASPPAISIIPTTPFSYSVTSPLNGVYTVGTGGAYTTLTAAVADYNSRCLSGPVTFSLTDTVYPTETYPININQNLDASTTNTLTIKPATGVSPTISGSSAIAIIKLNGADNIIIDGSNTATSRDLTIINTNVGTSSVVLWNASLDASNGAVGNVFKNLKILGQSPTTTLACIVSGSGAIIANNAQKSNDSFTVLNNSISKAVNGIISAGPPTSQTNNIISQNSIGSAVVSEYISKLGIGVNNNSAIQITKNTIFNIVTGSGLDPTGINISTNVSGAIIDSNVITNLAYTGITGFGGHGIDINTGLPTSNITVSNNMISELKGDSWTSFLNDAIIGIRIGATGNSANTTGGINLYNNSINLASGSFAGSSNATVTSCIYVSAAATNIDVRNNVLVNNLLNSVSATGKSYSIFSAAPITAFTNINYNDYAVSGSQGILGSIGATDRITLANMITGFGGNAASISVVPLFTSASNLHANDASLDNLGTPIASVATDIDGDLRSATSPDIGADEFTFLKVNYFDVAPGFDVYPNPASDILNIEYTSNLTNVSVYNLLGQQVFDKKVSATATSIDMSGLNSGTYLVKIEANNTSKTIKVFKK